MQTESHNPTIDFINVCTTAEYNEKHIAGVRSVPLDELEQHLPEFSGKKTIYIHCRSGRRGAEAIQRLTGLGVQAELVNVEGGLIAWEGAGFATMANTTRMPLMRQVFLGAGGIALVGSVFALTIDPRFVYVPLVVSLGLVISGATGWCGMAFLLSRMPWNR